MIIYFRHIGFDCRNEKSYDFCCSRHRSLHGKETLHSRRRKKAQHDHEIKRTCMSRTVFRQSLKCSACSYIEKQIAFMAIIDAQCIFKILLLPIVVKNKFMQYGE